MTWSDLPPAERAQLTDQLTHKQLLIYICRLAHPAPGSSWTSIAILTNLQIRTCRNHYHAALIKHQQIREALAKQNSKPTAKPKPKPPKPPADDRDEEPVRPKNAFGI